MDFISIDKVHYLLVWDYIIIGLVLGLSATIGIYYGCTGGKQKTTKEFYLADSNMGVLPTALSLFGSMVNAIMILGTASEVYYHDSTIWYLALCPLITIPVSAYLFLPVYFKLELTSAYEYLEKRFNKYIRRLGSSIFMIQALLFSAGVLYTPSLALSQVTGLDLWASIISLGVVCVFYTTLGGIKAVIWTDVLQIVVMFGCLFPLIIVGNIKLGGFLDVWQKNVEGKRIQFMEFNPDPLVRHSFWSILLGGSFSWMSFYSVNQAFIQRYLSTASINRAQKALWCNVVCLMLLVTLCVFGGFIVYAAYWNCDPLQTQRIKKPDQILPLFVMDLFSSYPGFPGLFIAGCFSGALSTVSSNIHALSSVAIKDFIKPCCWENISDVTEVWLSKLVTVCFGVIAILLVALIEKMENIITMAYNITGLLGGPLLGLVSLGIFCPKANPFGVGFGTIGSLALSLWIAIGSQIYNPPSSKNVISVEGCIWNKTVLNVTDPENSIKFTDVDVFPLYKISYMWYGPFSCIATVIIGLLASCISDLCVSSGDVDDRFIPKLTKWWKKTFTKKLPNSNNLNSSISENIFSIGQYKQDKTL